MYLVVLAVLVSVWPVSTQHVHYVLPDGSSPLNCPAQPCLTLDQYTQDTGTYFTTGATFLFLAGNHSLQTAVNLTNISDVTLRGEREVNVIFSNTASIFCYNITNLKIKSLALVFSLYDIAVSILESKSINIFDCNFQRNIDQGYGKALEFISSSGKIQDCVFENNRGGAIYSRDASITISGCKFIGNRAVSDGGALYVSDTDITSINIIEIQNCIFEKNRGYDGGAISIFVSDASITISGSKFIGNEADSDGGALHVSDTSIILSNCVFEKNRGDKGGAIFANDASITISRSKFIGNNALSGGALYASDTRDITLNDAVNFTLNTAESGGAMYISSESSLTLNHHTTLTTSHNNASRYGGAIYYEDTRNIYDCFLRLGDYEDIHINSYFDTADRDGSFLYGGLLDRCRLSINGTYNYSIIPYNFLTEGGILNIESNNSEVKAITSELYGLYFCDSDACDEPYLVSISRGQKFIISVKAITQDGVTSAQVTAVTGIFSRILHNQITQTTTKNNCTSLEYNFYSYEGHDSLRLITRGSYGEAVIEVTLLPCPHPFVHVDDECACDKRLQEYTDIQCIIDEHNNSYITKTRGTDFWMSFLFYHTNNSYESLVLCKICPPEYCRTQTDVTISLDNLDSQCDDNRGGVLCGQCLANYSLMLGSSKCRCCSNRHLALLLPFAAAGIALVVFLSFLRLTVATGMINSVILYANILQANRNLIFPVNARNILTVFVAWMNLDLGFETCFYDGMTAYAQTWLQFAFPLYVWILIIFIILSSRYSMTVSKLIGHNPIAVLATLLLMSYTKLLKIIIEVYSSVELDYPDNHTVTVWLKDANVPYLESRHLLLTVVTTLVIVLFFLPYTLLLLLGYKLYCFSGRKCFHWINRIKPLLESYYAPYSIHTRYWTGFLLLVRCILYIIFSSESFENSKKSLLAIGLTFTTLLVLLLMLLFCFSHQLYTNLHNNIVEASIYLNLIMITLAVANPPALVYSLVGLVFVTMLGIIVYHFHLLYIAQSQVWQQLKVQVSTLREKLACLATRTAAEPPVHVDESSHDPHQMVTYSEVELREPLL